MVVHERTVLPRLRDVALDLASLVGGLDSSGQVALAGLDVSDAFHLTPLRRDEWRFALARVRDRIYVFRVTIFAAASAPLVWSRVAALLGRTTAAVMLPHTARVQIYVDDPIISLASSTLGTSSWPLQDSMHTRSPR